MSSTENTGLQLPEIDGIPVADPLAALFFFLGIQQLIDEGIVASDLVTYSGSSLVVSGGLFNVLSVAAYLNGLMGEGTAEALAGLDLEVTLADGSLDINGSGVITGFGGSVEGFQFTNGGPGTSTSVVFVPYTVADLMAALADGPGDDSAGFVNDLRDFFIPEGIAYFYTGGPARESVLLGGDFNDVFGGDGNDVFFAPRGSGFGTVNGGNGLDRFDGSLSEARLDVNLGAGTAFFPPGGGPRFTLIGIENATGTDFGDLLTGSGGRNRLDGGLGRDALSGLGGNDVLIGDNGDDSLFGGGGNDNLNGGTGHDLLDGGNGQDTLAGGAGNDTLLGAAQGQVQEGGAGDDSLSGGAGNDTLIGGKGKDTLNGGAGNDSLTGGKGKDVLEGGAGNDTLVGGEAGDTLVGGTGNDTLQGGSSGDTFIFRTDLDQGEDWITDFDRDEGDRIIFYDTNLTIADVTITFDAETGASTITYPTGDGGTSTILVENANVTATDLDFVAP